MPHVQIRRHDNTACDVNNICLPAMNRPTDQIHHAEHMADVMDQIPGLVAGKIISITLKLLPPLTSMPLVPIQPQLM